MVHRMATDVAGARLMGRECGWGWWGAGGGRAELTESRAALLGHSGSISPCVYWGGFGGRPDRNGGVEGPHSPS